MGQLALCYDTSMNNLPADQNLKPTSTGSSPVAPTQPTINQPAPAGGVQKEVEFPRGSETPMVEETLADVELSPEVEASGVQKKSETIDLPPDIRQMGVEAVGPTQPHGGGTTVKLPLDDTQIVQGLHAQILNSLRWLAEWCIRQLKKAHFHLRVISGQVVRERE